MADDGSEQALIKIAVMAEVKQHFRPEFVNRIDEIVVFNPLDEANIASIARIQLKGLEERLGKLEIKLASPTTRSTSWRRRASTRSTARGR